MRVVKPKMKKIVGGFALVGVVLATGMGCHDPVQPPIPQNDAQAIFKPQELADALHAVIAADQNTYAMAGDDDKVKALHVQRLNQAAASIQQQGAEFHYVLRSLWPVNSKNGPQTETEKRGLQYVIDHPGINFYEKESLGGREYFTAIYAETASSDNCLDCHNQNSAGGRKDFKRGDIMGGLVVRVPVEF